MAADSMVPLLGDKGAIALGAAWSQSSIGSGAMGAVSERPELAGNVLIWIAIPETIVLLGFVVGLLLALNLGAE